MRSLLRLSVKVSPASDSTIDAFAFSYSAAHAASDAFLACSNLAWELEYAASAIAIASSDVSESSEFFTASEIVFAVFLFGFAAFCFASSNSAFALAASASASETDVGPSFFPQALN